MLNEMEKKYWSSRVEVATFLDDVIFETKVRIQDINEEILFDGEVHDFYNEAFNIFKKLVYSVKIEDNTLVVIVIDGL